MVKLRNKNNNSIGVATNLEDDVAAEEKDGVPYSQRHWGRQYGDKHHHEPPERHQPHVHVEAFDVVVWVGVLARACPVRWVATALDDGAAGETGQARARARGQAAGRGGHCVTGDIIYDKRSPGADVVLGAQLLHHLHRLQLCSSGERRVRILPSPQLGTATALHTTALHTATRCSGRDLACRRRATEGNKGIPLSY